MCSVVSHHLFCQIGNVGSVKGVLRLSGLSSEI